MTDRSANHSTADRNARRLKAAEHVKIVTCLIRLIRRGNQKKKLPHIGRKYVAAKATLLV